MDWRISELHGLSQRLLALLVADLDCRVSGRGFFEVVCRLLEEVFAQLDRLDVAGRGGLVVTMISVAAMRLVLMPVVRASGNPLSFLDDVLFGSVSLGLATISKVNTESAGSIIPEILANRLATLLGLHVFHARPSGLVGPHAVEVLEVGQLLG